VSSSIPRQDVNPMTEAKTSNYASLFPWEMSPSIYKSKELKL
jgi:hypothetical protein